MSDHIDNDESIKGNGEDGERILTKEDERGIRNMGNDVEEETKTRDERKENTPPDETRSRVSSSSSTDSEPSNSTVHQNADSQQSKENEVSEVKSSSIVVENATKYYGRGKSKVVALRGLSMRVSHGTIYGLLGPSGCGKTTLLGCLVNRLKLDRGRILLFGFPPGSREAAVPGGRVGFMPQEIALYQEFTIKETLQYIGRINQLHSLIIKERTNFLVKFLDLPNTNRLINQLSGGQQRRVSLAAALLHEPELLILDEPTVGVDPLLRTSIWKHLIGVCASGNTTIVITTHYIEEANQAHKVGLMRSGRLLAESKPQNLMNHFGFSSLERVFLHLCMEEGDLEDDNKQLPLESVSSAKSEREETVSKSSREEPFRDEFTKMVYVKPWVSFSKREKDFSMARNKALIIKNLIRMKRNVGFLIFSFILPVFQTVLFCLTIGGTPHDLTVAVVNLDDPPPLYTSISDLYLDNLDSYIIVQNEYDTFEEGYDSVEEGKNWGLIFMNKTFSSGIILNDKEKDGMIHIYMDDTNLAISITVKINLLEAMTKTIEDVVSSNPLVNLSNARIPIRFEEPVYYIEDSSFRNFAAPGVLLTIIYFMAVGLTSLAFIIEKKEGLLERSWVSGVRTTEVLFSHLITQMMVMAVQITLVMVFMFPVFQIPCKGSLVWVVLLSILQGVCGMSFGLMVSGLSKDELTAIQIILGTFYPIILISGIVWPIEGMPNALRYISYIFPQTYACEGIRAVLYRGWDITYFEVYIGYIITFVWMLLHLGIAVFAIRI